MIGSLMYLTASRPDIMFAVSAYSRHQVTPLTSHLNAVKKIFNEAYSDSDYAGSHGDRKSTTGGCQFLGRRLISWQCKKQTIVATSSTEAEYVAAASCCAQVLKIHTDDNVADLLTKAFDGPRFEYLVVHIGMSICCCCIISADRLVSAGSTMILLGVILPAGCFVSAGSYGLCCWFRVHAGRHTSPGGFISADRVCIPAVCTVSAVVISAGSHLFMLSQLSFYAQFDFAGWLVSATSHSVSAGRSPSCCVINWSANTFDTPMLAIAAAGDDAAGSDDAANEDNAAVNEAAGSAAEAPLVPYSTPVSLVQEPTPEQPWPYVPEHSLIRDPTPEPASPPTPPAQTFLFEVPLVFGPEPRPAGYVDPDVIEPIIFGPRPRPHVYVDPDFVEPIIFGPQPRPDNYLELEDLDNVISMDDDTTHGGFHEESPVRPDDAPTPTADAAGRAEDPALLTSLSAKLDRCMGHIDSLENELGKSKKIMGGAILTLVSRVKKLEKTVKQLREGTTRLGLMLSTEEGGVDIQDDIDLDGLSRMASAALGQPAVPSDDVEEREEEEVPLRRKRSAYRRARTEFLCLSWYSAEFSCEDAQARKNASKRNGRSEPWQIYGCELSRKAMKKEIEVTQLMRTWLKINDALKRSAWSDVLMLVFSAATTSYWLMTLILLVGGSSILGSCLGAPVTDSTVTTPAAMDSAGSHREIGVSPFADSAASSSPSNVSTDHIPIDVLFESTSGGINDFFLESDEEEQIGMSRVAATPDSDDEVLAEILFRGKSISGDGVVLVDKRIWMKRC
ncbi:hypothetical protein Tco_0799108 [Tanacetum coccineum]